MFIKVLSTVLLLCLPGGNVLGDSKHTDPEIYMNPEELITSKGYPCETRQVVTEDGYILTVYRIPHGNNRDPVLNGTNSKPVVFLQHGFLCSATNWLTNLANESLGFILADAGMDVWLGNFRGNTYSTNHTTLNVADHKFWEFSWDEMAAFDLPAMIGLALEVSGAHQLYYVGHSMGTQTAFAQFSQDLALGARIKHYFALAPVAKGKHMKGLLGYLGNNYQSIGWLVKLFSPNAFLPSSKVVKELAKYVCANPDYDPLCENIFFLIGGTNSTQMNASRVPVYVGHVPAGTSTQNVIHYAQNVQDGKFDMYDHGYMENLKKYHQATPPEYHPENMQTPVSLFVGDLDWLADPLDVQYLLKTLKTIKNTFVYKDFNHFDFIWGMEAPAQVYSKIVNIIRSDN